MSVRIETDTMGEIEVPDDRYWGAQSQRSLKNFKIGTERMPRELIRGLGILKQAAARVNASLGVLDQAKCDLIVKAADDRFWGKIARKRVRWMSHDSGELTTPDGTVLPSDEEVGIYYPLKENTRRFDLLKQKTKNKG